MCKTIKSKPETDHIKVLVVSGYPEQGFIEQAMESGADDWVGKPFKLLDKLNERVEALLATKSSQNGLQTGL